MCIRDRSQTLQIVNKNGTTKNYTVNVSEGYDLRVYPYYESNDFNDHDNGVYISYGLSQVYNIHEGDTITVSYTHLRHGILRKYANQGQIIQLQISQDVSALSDIQHTMKKYGIAIQSMKVEVLDRNTLFIEIDGVTPQTFNREELLDEMMNKNCLLYTSRCV